MKIKRLSLGELGTNCYIVYEEGEALIFDPGAEAKKVTQFLDTNDLQPKAILLTHAHFDHIGAVDELRRHYDLEVYLHEEEEDWLEEPALNRSTAFMRDQVVTAPPEHLLKPGRLEISRFSFEIVHTPGHSPGSVTFIFADHEFVISGDVLFQRGVGRTDLPQGSMAVLVQSIRTKLYVLPDSFTVYSGHGIPTSIGDEKLNNPFVPGK